jgi:hypothetical protein
MHAIGRRLGAVAIVLVTLAGCAGPAASPTASPAPSTSGAPVTDYGDASNWLLAPVTADKPVDVFYVYPTTYAKPEGSDASANLASVKDAGMRAGAKIAYDRQASAFAGTANVYAPFYRQLDAGYALTLPLDAHVAAISGAPTDDVTAAFAYYIDHFNGGRPFAIAGHSQGSDVATYPLAGYFKAHPDIAKRMVVAYVIGYAVTQAYLDANPHLRYATGADDTGVIVSYNTEAPTIGAPSPVMLPGAIAINPITWTRGAEVAPASKSLGAWLPDASGVWRRVPAYADAAVDSARGVVVTTTADVDAWAPGGPKSFPRGVFHATDYPFYYFDLQANFEARVAAYRRANP